MNETGDLRPDYVQLRNLFRQVQPSYMVTSGPNHFLEDIIKLIDLPEGTDYAKFKIKKSKSATANNIAIYPFNRKNNLSGFRKQIYELNLPGLPSECSRSDRQMFVDSVFPMDQDLMVHSLGNLLQYLNDNNSKWRQVFLNLDRNPIITNLNVFYMESQVLMDDSTFNALNIFSNITHPSSFKNQIRKDGLSLFNLLNQCCSSIGVQELKVLYKSKNIFLMFELTIIFQISVDAKTTHS